MMEQHTKPVHTRLFARYTYMEFKADFFACKSAAYEKGMNIFRHTNCQLDQHGRKITLPRNAGGGVAAHLTDFI